MGLVTEAVPVEVSGINPLSFRRGSRAPAGILASGQQTEAPLIGGANSIHLLLAKDGAPEKHLRHPVF